MALVGYADSESSDDESLQTTTKQKAPQKLVSKSNPHKITVNLPAAERKTGTDELDEAAPTAKRQKIGGGLGGFNAMLPLPKRQVAGPAKGKGIGLGKGVSLRTGAEPAFSREPPMEQSKEHPSPPDTDVDAPDSEASMPAEVKPIGNPMRFKPLSVTRKPQKKKPALPVTSTSSTDPQVTTQGQGAVKPAQKPKISLFPMEDADEKISPASSLQLGELRDHEKHDGAQSFQTGPSHVLYDSEALERRGEEQSYESFRQGRDEPPVQTGETLDSIASDLHLSASARRQLLGRGNKGANVKVTNFNVETEYAANEAARRTGEQQEQQTVRSIVPGKHSLRQLVNQVSGQKEALEESFASGRRNKKEAGSKYGW